MTTSFIKLLSQAYCGHYRVFIRASEAFWNGKQLYGTDFETGVGRFFYTPFAALFYYPFSILGEKLGLALLSLLCIGVFSLGFFKFCKTYLSQKQTFLFILFSSPQVFSAIVACKPELLIVGLILWGASSGLRALLSSLIFGVAFKFQPLPFLGLLCLWELKNKKSIKQLTLNVILSLVALLLLLSLPVLCVGVTENIQSYQSLFLTLGEFSQQAFLSFDNIYGALHHWTGFPSIYSQAVILQFLAAVLCGAIILARSSSVLEVLGLASLYIVLFSPLQQNNAYILWLPFLGFILSQKPLQKIDALLILFFIFGYSDLFSKVWTDAFRSVGLKSTLLLILGFRHFYRQSLFAFFKKRETF